MGGALTTFAGFKGFGLSLYVQLLGILAFAMAGFPGGHAEDGAGTFSLAIDPGLFAGTEYMTRSRELIDSIRAARPIEGQRVSLPGERGDAIAAAEASGEIDVAEEIWQELELRRLRVGRHL